MDSWGYIPTYGIYGRGWNPKMEMDGPFQVGRSSGEPWASVKIQGGRFGSSYKWSDIGPPQLAENKQVTEVRSYNSTCRDYFTPFITGAHLVGV